MYRIGPTKTAKYGDRCFMKAAASVWNPLPVFLKFSVSVSSFKRNVKTYLLNEYMINDFSFTGFKNRFRVYIYNIYIKRYISNV